MATRILERSNFSLGVQIVFYHHWSKWVQSFEQSSATNVAPANVFTANEPSNALQTQPSSNEAGIIAQSQTQTTKDPHLDLSKILQCAPYGPAVLTYYKSHSSLDDKTRKLLVEASLHYCITVNIKPTMGSCQKLAKLIAETLNGEIAV